MFKRALLLVAALAFATTAGSNDWYNHSSGVPATGSLATSATMRAEFDAIKTGFDLLPSLPTNGDKSIFVNSGGTALTALDAATARSKLAAAGTGVANVFSGANTFSSGLTASPNGTFTPTNANVENSAVSLSGSFGGGLIFKDTGRIGIWSQVNGTELHVGIGTSSGVVDRTIFGNGLQVTNAGVAPTGGDCGGGCINAAGGVRVNNDPVATKGVTNTFTADQTIQFVDPGAGGGPSLFLDRSSASPAASDVLGLVSYFGRNSAAAAVNYGGVYANIDDPTNGSEDGSINIQAVIAGTMRSRMTVGQGIQVRDASGNPPTGGDKGPGTGNFAGTIYQNNDPVATVGAANSFTNTSGNIVSSVTPRQRFTETDAAVDNKNWDILINGEQFRMRAYNDADSIGTDWIAVDRTGTTIDTVNFPNGTLQAGGVRVATPVLSTEQATTSGSTITFSGIPSTATRIRMMLVNVSVAGTGGTLSVRIGSGSLDTSLNYADVQTVLANAGAVAIGGTTSDSQWSLENVSTNAATYSGYVEMVLENASTNRWTMSAMIVRTDTGTAAYTTVGNKTLSGTLDRVALLCGADTFDAGSVNIRYE